MLDFSGSCCHCLEGGRNFSRLGYQMSWSGVGGGESLLYGDEGAELGHFLWGIPLAGASQQPMASWWGEESLVGERRILLKSGAYQDNNPLPVCIGAHFHLLTDLPCSCCFACLCYQQDFHSIWGKNEPVWINFFYLFKGWAMLALNCLHLLCEGLIKCPVTMLFLQSWSL